MTTSRPDRQPFVIFCCCVHYDIIPAAVKEQTLNSLLRTGLDVEVVDDLCGLTANRDPRLAAKLGANALAGRCRLLSTRDPMAVSCGGSAGAERASAVLQYANTVGGADCPGVDERQ